MGAYPFPRVNVDAWQAPWFYGFMPSEEAARVLHNQVPGTFLVSFHQLTVDQFNVAFVDVDGAVNQVLVRSALGGGYKLENGALFLAGLALTAAGADATFESLHQLVSAFSSTLCRPAPPYIRRCQFFHGFMSFGETQGALARKAVGTYLVRFSQSAPNSLVLAFVNKSGSVEQCHVKPVRDGFELGDHVYRDLRLVTPLLTAQFNSGNPELQLEACSSRGGGGRSFLSFMRRQSASSSCEGGGGGGGGAALAADANAFVMRRPPAVETAAATGAAAVPLLSAYRHIWEIDRQPSRGPLGGEGDAVVAAKRNAPPTPTSL